MEVLRGYSIGLVMFRGVLPYAYIISHDVTRGVISHDVIRSGL